MSVPVFSELETLTVDGAGEMEAFLSDGLRTLVETLPQVPRMEEKTLRWPGHVAAVRPLVERGTFLDEFRARCVVDRPQDLVALVVRVRRGGSYLSPVATELRASHRDFHTPEGIRSDSLGARCAADLAPL